ncbi:hypothetical protein D3C76_1605280 [compost metagenome]
MEAYYKSIDMPISIKELGVELNDDQIKELAYKCSFQNTRTVGGVKALNTEDMIEIYKMAR